MPNTTNKVAEVKKLEDGRIAVRWTGKRSFNIVTDPVIAQYLIYWMVKGEDHTMTPFA